MSGSGNKLLSSLSVSDFDLLAPHLESVTLGVRKMLEPPNKTIEAVYFPESGFASVVAVQPGGKEVEVGLIGREGMTGLPKCSAITARRTPPTCRRPGTASVSQPRNCDGQPRRVRPCTTRC
jgi:hypothetical protein